MQTIDHLHPIPLHNEQLQFQRMRLNQSVQGEGFLTSLIFREESRI
jgi:hypothetical protein